MASKNQFVTVDELVSGRLPTRIVEAVNSMEMSVEEVADLERNKPSFKVTITDGEVWVQVNKRYSMKKLLTVIASVVGTVWAIIQFVVPHLV